MDLGLPLSDYRPLKLVLERRLSIISEDLYVLLISDSEASRYSPPSTVGSWKASAGISIGLSELVFIK